MEDLFVNTKEEQMIREKQQEIQLEKIREEIQLKKNDTPVKKVI